MKNSHPTPRYAIYFVPEPTSPLMQKASSWLGRDIFKNCKCAFPDTLAISAEIIENITKSPRNYGFHGTLKAPFRLAEEKSEEELEGAFFSFCKAQEAFHLSDLKLSEIGNFHALTCSKTSIKIEELASNAVQEFEPFRAELQGHEIQKRNPESLTNQQRDYLMKWGYPYVFDEFHFHLTLTDKLHKKDDLIKQVLETYFEDVLSKPLKASVALAYQENPQSPFYVRQFVTLGA